MKDKENENQESEELENKRGHFLGVGGTIYGRIGITPLKDPCVGI